MIMSTGLSSVRGLNRGCSELLNIHNVKGYLHN
jgi:hypothetical protein